MLYRLPSGALPPRQRWKHVFLIIMLPLAALLGTSCCGEVSPLVLFVPLCLLALAVVAPVLDARDVRARSEPLRKREGLDISVPRIPRCVNRPRSVRWLMRWCALVAALAGVLASLSPPSALGALASRCALVADPARCLDVALDPLMPLPAPDWARSCRALGPSGLGDACADRFSMAVSGSVALEEQGAADAIDGCAIVGPSERSLGDCACLVWDAAREVPVDVAAACSRLGGARDRCAECASRAAIPLDGPGRAIDACLAAGKRRDPCLGRAAFALARQSLSLAREACDGVSNATARLGCRRAIAPLAARRGGPNATAVLCEGDVACLAAVAREGAAADPAGAEAVCSGLPDRAGCLEGAAASLARTDPGRAAAACSGLEPAAVQDACLLSLIRAIPPDRPADMLAAAWALSTPDARDDAVERAWDSSDLEAYLRTCERTATDDALERCRSARGLLAPWLGVGAG